jgi:hypothetical protein
MTNFQSDVEELKLQHFSICKVTNRNWEEVKDRFPGYTVSHNSHYYIQRGYKKIPQNHRDQVGLGSIPYDSEDLMLLLRLFKPNDIGFECADFDTFLVAAPHWPGWNSSWFKISRRYFLWGSTKEFNVMRERIAEWELERILDFFIVLEAALVPEIDFVGRRLRERAATLLNLDSEAAKVLKKRLMALYRVRSTIAHGDVIEESQVKTLREAIPYFETDVRDLVKAALQCCPVDEISRRSWLKSLYDVSDQDRVDKLREDFKSIKTDSLKHELLKDIGSGHLPP